MHYIINIKNLYYKGICWSGEIISQNFFFASKLDCHNLLEISTQARNWEVEKKPKIMAIPNKYKDIYNNLIDSLDDKSSDWLGLINKRSCNMPRFESSSIDLSKKNYYLNNKNILNTLLGLVSKIWNIQIYWYYNVGSFCLKKEKTQYKKSQRNKKYKKDKRDRKNKKGKRDKKSY